MRGQPLLLRWSGDQRQGDVRSDHRRGPAGDRERSNDGRHALRAVLYRAAAIFGRRKECTSGARLVSGRRTGSDCSATRKSEGVLRVQYAAPLLTDSAQSTLLWERMGPGGSCRASNPVRGPNKVPGGFDSHTLSPFSRAAYFQSALGTARSTNFLAYSIRMSSDAASPGCCRGKACLAPADGRGAHDSTHFLSQNGWDPL